MFYDSTSTYLSNKFLGQLDDVYNRQTKDLELSYYIFYFFYSILFNDDTHFYDFYCTTAKYDILVQELYYDLL